MTDDIVEFIRARLEDDRLEATPHTIMHSGGPPGGYIPNCIGPTGHGCPERWMIDAPTPAAEHAHAMTHATAKQLKELRGVEAKRMLISDLLAQDHFLDDREWYGCRAVTEDSATGTYVPTGQPCTCGRDEDVERRLRLIASEWSTHESYKEEWAP